MNFNNSAAFMGLKNVSTNIIANRDNGDIKTEDQKKLTATTSALLVGQEQILQSLTTTAVENNF